MTPEETYSKLRWGNSPAESFDIEAPESMVTLGDVAQLITENGTAKFSEDDAPFLAIGVETNRIYIVPKNGDLPVNIPEFSETTYQKIGEIEQTDYYSDKGGEEAYYYHEHEAPYPTLYMHEESGVCVLIPAEMDDGSRSYAVGDEGVIG
jgi:hypothetical protein